MSDLPAGNPTTSDATASHDSSASDAAASRDAAPRYVNHADLGGVTGRGPVNPEVEEPLFHAAWERRVLALTLAMGGTGVWNIDRSRSVRETQPDYRQLSYYAMWLGGLERLLMSHGLVAPDELASGRSVLPPVPLNAVPAAEVAVRLARGAPTERPALRPAAFAVGARVITTAAAAAHHTRLPGYLRGKTGVIERVHGMHVFPDANSRGLGERPDWLYTVVFAAPEVWGAAAAPGDRISCDAWEPYLEAAP